MKRLSIVVALGLLGGCAHTSTKVEPIFAEVLKQPPLAESILRDGDQLSYQVEVTPSKGSSVPDIAQVRASCAATDASLQFLESPGTLAANGQPTRFTVMRNLTAPVVAYLKQNSAFAAACANTPRPDWRLVGSTSTQRQLLIDRASLKPVGDRVQVWGSVDEPVILTDKLRKMPYAQTRTHWQVSCNQKTYRTLASFGLNQKNIVTFGNIERAPQDKPFNSADADTQTLLNAACSPTLTQLPVATARTKAQQTLTPPPLSAEVNAAISALNMPPASKALRHLVQDRDMGYSPMRSNQYIEPGAERGQFKVRHVTQYSSSALTTFRGLITLTFQSQFELHGVSTSAASHIQELGFTGDWQQMPVGATLGYRSKDLNRNTAEDDRVLERTTTCVVKRELPASKINSSLSGNAKELSCSATGGQYQATSTEMYLQDYGYFFTTQSNTNGTKMRNTLVKAE